MKNLTRRLSALFFVFVFIGLTACSGSDSPESVSADFWEAVQDRNMEKAKQLSTWDTVEYLKILKAKNFHPERFELGDKMAGDSRAEIDTTLYTTKQGKSGIKVPGVTVLLKTDQGWRVDVKKTLGSVIKYSVNNVFDQLNGLLEEGVKELDKTISESVNELGQTLKDSADELKKELNRPIFPRQNTKPPVPPIKTPQGQQI